MIIERIEPIALRIPVTRRPDSRPVPADALHLVFCRVMTREVSLLQKQSGDEIGVPMKVALDDVRQSESAPLCCDQVSLRGF